ncbi:hypothetical protein C8R21_14113 [Nitrosospira multiformis]|uniref:Uncharacterized protein n=1 Tax=Nitrosospira multiformis TaxID=1231 RepID=A0A2T5I4C2_9PROT|nr:hypothetical protein [Nitrosospira multiformis]PTQ78679.1 hypothetical protein C8R21_14113 [Nitrosospira multiformis]
MKKRRPDQTTPFSELPRSRRRDLYVRLRWKITRKASYYGGKFTSDALLDEAGRPGPYKQWIDCLFLGGDGLTIWNATIVTATQQFWDEARLLAEERASSLLIDEQEEDGFIREGPFLANGQKYFRMVKRQPKAYACLGGLTRQEYEEQCERAIIENEPPVIHESFTIESGYRYGIGLYAIVQADEINREVIERTIERFREVGEKDWQSECLVSRELLPVETQENALSRIHHLQTAPGAGEFDEKLKVE